MTHAKRGPTFRAERPIVKMGGLADKRSVEEIRKNVKTVRAEVRLSAEDAEKLDLLAMKLRRERDAGQDRISRQTLLQLGVEMVLEQTERMEGNGVNDLRRSVGLAPRIEGT